MRKLFFAICFTVFSINQAIADVHTLDTAAENRQKPSTVDPFQAVEGMPNPNNLDEVINFFKKRFQNAHVSTRDQMGDLSKPGTIDIQHSKEYIDDMILNQEQYMKENYKLRKEYIFNIGKAAEIEGKYIIERYARARKIYF